MKLLKIIFLFLKVKWLHDTGEVEIFTSYWCRFFRDLTHQNSLKSVNFWQSYLKKSWRFYGTQCRLKQSRMWADAQRDGSPAEYRRRLCESSVIPFPVLRSKLWLTPTAQVPCSNAANIAEHDLDAKWILQRAKFRMAAPAHKSVYTSSGDGRASCKVWLTSVERRRCSNEAKTRNPPCTPNIGVRSHISAILRFYLVALASAKPPRKGHQGHVYVIFSSFSLLLFQWLSFA